MSTARAGKGDSARSAAPLGSNIVKTGYMIKRATKSGLNWRRRYFVLNGNTITYYNNHKSLDSPAKGDFLLTTDTIVNDTWRESGPNANEHTFEIETPFGKLQLSCESAEEKQNWVSTIRGVVASVGDTMRGYLDKKSGGIFSGWSRKFAILHTDSITFHENHLKTHAIVSMFRFTKDSTVARSGPTRNTIHVRRAPQGTAKGNECVMRITGEGDEVDAWCVAIENSIEKLQAPVFADNKPTENVTDPLMRGFLLTKLRGNQGGRSARDSWPQKFFVLTPSHLKMYEDEDSVTPLSTFVLEPSGAVFETNLKPFAFELVTSKKVVHLQGGNQEETGSWMRALRDAILNSVPQERDPLLEEALLRQDTFYTITFEEKRPLGLVLERSGEWAMVKMADTRQTGVRIGSALHSINGERVSLKPYMDVIRKLTGWQPPLNLTFRAAPEKRGWLTKQSRGRSNARVVNWRPRYFVVGGGRIKYYTKTDDDPQAELKGDVQLMGAGVSLVPRAETRHYFCFQLVSGVTKLVMQALTVEDMMDWAVTLYHAIAIANGGSYILGMERAEETRRAKEDEARTKVEDTQRQLDMVEEQRRQSMALRGQAVAAAAKQVEDEEEQRLAAEEERLKEEMEEAETEMAALEFKAEEEKKAREEHTEQLRTAAQESIQEAIVDENGAPSEGDETKDAAAGTAAATAGVAALAVASQEGTAAREAAEAEARETEAAARKALEAQRAAEAAEAKAAADRADAAARAKREAEEAEAAAAATAAAAAEAQARADAEAAAAKEAEAAAAAEAQVKARKEAEEAAAAEATAKQQAAVAAAAEERAQQEAVEAERRAAEIATADAQALAAETAREKTPQQHHVVSQSLTKVPEDLAHKTDAGEPITPRPLSSMPEVDTDDEMTPTASSRKARRTSIPDAPELTREVLEGVYSSLDVGASTGNLNAMQFSALRRAITGQENLFKEMQLYNRFSGGEGIMTKEMFITGFLELNEDKRDREAETLVMGVRNFAAANAVML